jgi:hypothetical protein
MNVFFDTNCAELLSDSWWGNIYLCEDIFTKKKVKIVLSNTDFKKDSFCGYLNCEIKPINLNNHITVFSIEKHLDFEEPKRLFPELFI